MSPPVLYLILGVVVLGGCGLGCWLWLSHVWKSFIEDARHNERIAEARADELADDEQWQRLADEVRHMPRHDE